MLTIGTAVRDFTPSRPAMLWGQMHVRVAHAAMDPLTLTAMAIEGDGACAIVIACDLVMVTAELIAAVRCRLGRQLPQVPPEAVLMAATHTHTSLVFEQGHYAHGGGDVMTAAECLELLVDRAAEAAVEAWQSRRPRCVASAFGHAVVGHNRRAVYADGSAVMYGPTNRPDFVGLEGCEDHGLDMLFVREPQGPLAAVVLTLPCPSQVDEQLSVYSADFWHDIRLELRRRLGAVTVLGLCGAGGDQSPHLLLGEPQEEQMLRRRGVSQRQEIALRVADAVDRALACTPEAADAPFARLTRRVELTSFPISREHRDWAAAAYQHCRQENQDLSSWWPSRQRKTVEAFDRGLPWPPRSVELHALRIARTAIVSNPFELYLDYAFQIKARSPAGQTAVVQLAGGGEMYLPTERAVRAGGYGAIPAVCHVGPEGGRQLVQASLDMLGELFSR
ncbi:MAG: hypothetical protein ABFD92_08460 [Planctomycetaceae bacterium]|nr:hypothetical protein [Planctomycetaceae bacterium]